MVWQYLLGRSPDQEEKASCGIMCSFALVGGDMADGQKNAEILYFRKSGGHLMPDER